MAYKLMKQGLLGHHELGDVISLWIVSKCSYQLLHPVLGNELVLINGFMYLLHPVW